ncbi:DUF3307 domain-containing protein [Marinicella sp. W31]|uniref:DUF3307 domain-containing protein n=1 Tax=Marinicella sp. W31 TaxID=3023713 RepID=UPI003756F54A
MTLLLSLLLAHILADFVLQPAAWVADKDARSWQSPKLYLHALTHGVISWAFLAFSGGYWLGILLIVISHFMIDLIKSKLQTNNNKFQLLLIDQSLHILIIVLISLMYEPQLKDLWSYNHAQLILVLICLFVLTRVSSIVVKTIISGWHVMPQGNGNDSLVNAGEFIGVLERLFIFTLVITNHIQAIGFLLAAKSIFRFGDLKEARDRKLTEYMLIGTLSSFGLATLTGIAYLKILPLITTT